MTAAVVEFCVCGHSDGAHGSSGSRCYFEAECGCVDYQHDSGRPVGREAQ